MDCAYNYHVSWTPTISLAFSSLVCWNSVAVRLRCVRTRDLMLSFWNCCSASLLRLFFCCSSFLLLVVACAHGYPHISSHRPLKLSSHLAVHNHASTDPNSLCCGRHSNVVPSLPFLPPRHPPTHPPTHPLPTPLPPLPPRLGLSPFPSSLSSPPPSTTSPSLPRFSTPSLLPPHSLPRPTSPPAPLACSLLPSFLPPILLPDASLHATNDEEAAMSPPVGLLGHHQCSNRCTALGKGLKAMPPAPFQDLDCWCALHGFCHAIRVATINDSKHRCLLHTSCEFTERNL